MSVRLHTDLKLINHSAQNPLDAHARKSLLLYIPSQNAGKNIINKSFNMLDSWSDPVRSRVEGSPAFSRYPGRANFPYNSLENSSNRFYAKHRLGSAGTRRATRLAGPLTFEGRVALLPGKSLCHAGIHFGSPTRVNLAICRFTACASVVIEKENGAKIGVWLKLTKLCCTSLNAWRNIKVCANSGLRRPAVNSVKRGNFFVVRTLGKVDSAGRVTLLRRTTFLHITRLWFV